MPNTEQPNGTAIPASALVGLIMRMLREAFDGAPGPWTYFSDTGPGNGLFATLDGLTAAQASRTGGPNESTIAGHVRHLRASLVIATKRLRGEEAPRDRTRTWTVRRVDETEWQALLAELHAASHDLRMTVQTRSVWDDDAAGDVFGAIAHTAYHLGAIRQRLRGGA